MRSEGTVVGSVCVCVCVCVSVTLHLTSRIPVRLINDTTYLTSNEGQKYQAVFSENGPLQKLERFHIIMPVGLRKMRMRIIFDHVAEKRPFCFSFSEKMVSSCIVANRPGMAATVPEVWALSRRCPGRGKIAIMSRNL